MRRLQLAIRSTRTPSSCPRYWHRRAPERLPAPLDRDSAPIERLDREQGLARRILGRACKRHNDIRQRDRGRYRYTPLSASAYRENFISLVGGTTLEELAYIISVADLFVGPVSGGMHLANAFHVPAVIIVGGYEAPAGYPYKDVSFFYSPVECAPCWAKTCPFDLNPFAPSPRERCWRRSRYGCEKRVLL